VETGSNIEKTRHGKQKKRNKSDEERRRACTDPAPHRYQECKIQGHHPKMTLNKLYQTYLADGPVINQRQREPNFGKS